MNLAFLTLGLQHVTQHRQLYTKVAIVLACVIALTWSVNRVRDAWLDHKIGQAEAKAMEAAVNAAVHEAMANAAKAQADALEQQRIEAERQTEIARRRVAELEARLAGRKKAYDEAQSDNADIDRTGTLDEREQRLLAKLRALYPGKPSGAN